MKKPHIRSLSLIIIISAICDLMTGQVPVDYNPNTGKIRLQDKKGNLIIDIDCRNRCVINYVQTLGNAVVSNKKGVYSSIKCNGKLYTTRSHIMSPKVISGRDSILIDGIIFGEKENQVSEKWIFQPAADYIDWTIE